jgi:putative ABC transport system permease protein
MLKGDRSTALVRPNTVVITEEMARKYFTDENPIGKSLRVHNDTMYEVTGVVADIPKNSHFRPDFFASFATLELKPTGNSAEDMLSNIDYATYLLLREDADLEVMKEKIAAYVEKHLGQVLENLGGTIRMELQPLTDIYLRSDLAGELERTGDIAYIYIFSAIGIFILALACLNFMNLSTARYTNRAREVGLRKVVGAGRRQLIRQFLGESLVLTVISVAISLGLVTLLLPLFRNISNKDISLELFSNPFLLIGILCLTAVISLVGGS